jgi:dihydrofolate reductase
MRKIAVLTFVTLDGVMQAPGGSKEDVEGDFAYGGWTHTYFDEAMGKVMGKQIGMPFDMLLGRKTYELFADYWPKQDEKTNPGAADLNQAKKYVVSNSSPDLSWKESILISGDAVKQIQQLKNGDGPLLQVHGSAGLLQTLLKHDLIDEFWLKIFPITIGSGKRLFGEGTIPAAFKLTESQATPSGVIVANYQRAGEVKTGSVV